MIELALAVAAFLAGHALPAAPGPRRRLVGVVGERAYLALYSLVSLGLLAWLGWAYARAPYVEVWPVVPALRWVPVLTMPVACVLLAAGLVNPNPLSIGRRGGFDPARPGIVSATRHPLPWALALWAGAHLPLNGDAASLVLFGMLLALSLAGPASLDAKARARLGDAAWRRLAAATSNVPLAAVAAGRARLDARGIGVPALVLGLGLYAALFLLHAPVIGISPVPW